MYPIESRKDANIATRFGLKPRLARQRIRLSTHFQPLFFKAPIKIMRSSKKQGSVSLRRSESRFIMKIFDRDGRKGWRFPKRWDYIVSNIAAVSIVKKKGL